MEQALNDFAQFFYIMVSPWLTVISGAMIAGGIIVTLWWMILTPLIRRW